MENKLYDLMNWPEIEGIVYSDSLHPKKILGQHVTRHGLLIQAYYPDALQAMVIQEDGKEIPMELVDEMGFFALLLPQKKPIQYHYSFVLPDQRRILQKELYGYPSMLSAKEVKAFLAGSNHDAQNLLGAREMTYGNETGILFAVWAPNAMRVSVVGPFNNWDGRLCQMEKHQSGIFELFIPDLTFGTSYKFEVRFKGSLTGLKGDPYARTVSSEDGFLSLVEDLTYEWKDQYWVENRKKELNGPLTILEVDLDQLLNSETGDFFDSYEEIGQHLILRNQELHFTHIELLTPMEHEKDCPHKVRSLYAPMGKYGDSKSFMKMIDLLHQAKIGVIADWVPSEFPKEEQGLAWYDGTCIYEHLDRRLAEYPLHNTLKFNYSRPEVQSYLVSGITYWLDQFHLDGIRMRGISSMLYHDYYKEPGQWIPNIYGGNENLEAVTFLKKLNQNIRKLHPRILVLADEDSAWPQVTGDPAKESLGFDYKWNRGWQTDFLNFMELDPLFRKGSYHNLLNSMIYAYSENFILALPQDIFANGFEGFLDKMPGTLREKYANVRTALGYFYTHPGKKSLFAGALKTVEEEHQGLAKYLGDLNQLYLKEEALWKEDHSVEGFEWINHMAAQETVLTFERKSRQELLIVAINFTPVIRTKYLIGVPYEGLYKEIFNSDSGAYGGSDAVNKRAVRGKEVFHDFREHAISITLPPLGITILKYLPEKTATVTRTKKK